MGWPDALIGAAAAVGGGALGAWVSLRQTREALNSDRELQRQKQDADEALSRELRQYQQRRDAYVPMMKYVTWAARVNQVRTEVIDRRVAAVQEVRPANVLDMTAEAGAAMRAAYESNGPTAWEQGMIDAGPTAEDRFAVLGLVNAFASNDVLDGFLSVVDGTERIEKAYVRVEKGIMNYPGPLGSDPSVSEVSEAAKSQIAWSAELFDASMELVDATKKYSAVVVNLRDTARTELDQIRVRAEPALPLS